MFNYWARKYVLCIVIYEILYTSIHVIVATEVKLAHGYFVL